MLSINLPEKVKRVKYVNVTKLKCTSYIPFLLLSPLASMSYHVKHLCACAISRGISMLDLTFYVVFVKE